MIQGALIALVLILRVGIDVVGARVVWKLVAYDAGALFVGAMALAIILTAAATGDGAEERLALMLSGGEFVLLLAGLGELIRYTFFEWRRDARQE